MIRGLVFDVDDTLTWERDYVREGFDHVARVFGSSDEEARILSSWLWGAFLSGVRGDTFDRLLTAFPDLAARTTVADLVDAYRTNRPNIHLVSGMAATLDELSAKGLRLGVLSDGPPESQAARSRPWDSGGGSIRSS